MRTRPASWLSGRAPDRLQPRLWSSLEVAQRVLVLDDDAYLGSFVRKVAEAVAKPLLAMIETAAGVLAAAEIALAARKLEKGLWGIATIATISPYLGLFATVVRILLTFGELAQSQSATQAPEIMFGIRQR